jgi:hypothetical protein
MSVITHDQHPVTRAWTAVVLVPVFFVIAFAIGEVVYSVLGYKPENDDAPLWVDLVGSLASLSVALIPCIAAVVYGRRAADAGNRVGLVPMAIGGLAAVARRADGPEHLSSVGLRVRVART